MYCKNCGKEIPIQAKFCSNCGFEVKHLVTNKAEETAEAAKEKIEENKTDNTAEIISEENNIKEEGFASEATAEKASEIEADKTTEEPEKESLKEVLVEASDSENEGHNAETDKSETKEKVAEASAASKAAERAEFVREKAEIVFEKAEFAREKVDAAREKAENFLKTEKTQGVLEKVKENKTAVILTIAVIIVGVLIFSVFSGGGKIYGSWEVSSRSIGKNFSDYPEDDFSIYENGTFTCDGISGKYYIDDDYLTMSAFWMSYTYEYKVKGNTLMLKEVEDEDSSWIYYDRVS